MIEPSDDQQLSLVDLSKITIQGSMTCSMSIEQENIFQLQVIMAIGHNHRQWSKSFILI